MLAVQQEFRDVPETASDELIAVAARAMFLATSAPEAAHGGVVSREFDDGTTVELDTNLDWEINRDTYLLLAKVALSARIPSESAASPIMKVSDATAKVALAAYEGQLRYNSELKLKAMRLALEAADDWLNSEAGRAALKAGD
jgi:hypothetical protein